METKQVAGLTFTKEGIMIEKKYNESNNGDKKFDESLYQTKYLDLAKRIAKYRMMHCYKQLHSNLAQAKSITPTQISWESGHFSVPVWEALEGILLLNDVRELSLLQAQQIIRSMLINCPNWVRDVNVNTWTTIESSRELSITDDFKNFITEHIMVVSR